MNNNVPVLFQKSVEYAEEVAANYSWNNDLQVLLYSYTIISNVSIKRLCHRFFDRIISKVSRGTPRQAVSRKGRKKI